MPDTIGLVFVVCGIAGCVSGATGFGFALVAVPLLSVAVDPAIAIGISTVAGIPGSSWIARRDRHYLQGRVVRLVAPASIACMPIGIVVLRVAPTNLLSVCIGAMVLLSTCLLYAGWAFEGSWRSYVAVGACSGTLATSTGTSGPPVVLLCKAIGLSARQLRATVATILATQCVFSLIGLVGSGAVQVRDLGVILLAQLPTGLGWVAGASVGDRLNHESIDRLTLWLLVISGATAILHGATT